MSNPFDPNLPMYYPCTALIIDDDEIFLQSLKKTLGRENAVLAFSSTGKALQHIHQTQDITSEAFNLFKAYGDIGEGIDAGDGLVVLQSSKVRQFASSRDRYKIISVIIIDQVMPNITGLEFCSMIKETGIKIILLTGHMSDRGSIDAFNGGLIDRYVNKNEPSVSTKIKHMISELHREYLAEKMAPIIKAFQASDKYLVNQHSTKTLLNKIYKVFKFTEYYYLPCSTGFLLSDASGNKNFCLLGLEQEQMELAGFIEEIMGPCEEVNSLRSGDFIAWNLFDDFGDNEPWQKKIRKLIFPCHRSDNIRWTLIPQHDTPYAHESNVVPWDIYKQKLRSISLNHAM